MPYFYGHGYGYYGYGSYYSTDMLLLFAMLAVMIIGFVAQRRVQSTFEKYNHRAAYCGKTAAEVAQELLFKNASAVTLTQVQGALTDHFNPKTQTVGLSQAVYGNMSVSALAVAAHEIGHVMQYEEGYAPIRIRNSILPAANLGSHAAPFIVILGLLFSSYYLAMAGVILFGAVLLFQLVTLPVEFNASARGIEMLTSGGYITADESGDAKRVLRAAAMTYVLATLASALSFLRILLIAQRTRRD